MTTLVVKGGTVVNADVSEVADVLIQDGLIKYVGRSLWNEQQALPWHCLPSSRNLPLLKHAY